jgi:Dna[CI] antecedent, DciA
MHPADSLNRLRANRNRPDPDLSLAALLGAEARRHKSATRAAGGVAKAWAEVVPDELADKAVVVRLRRGVLAVRVRDAASMYRLNQWLGSGGIAALRARSGRGISRVAFMHT